MGRCQLEGEVGDSPGDCGSGKVVSEGVVKGRKTAVRTGTAEQADVPNARQDIDCTAGGTPPCGELFRPLPRRVEKITERISIGGTLTCLDQFSVSAAQDQQIEFRIIDLRTGSEAVQELLVDLPTVACSARFRRNR